MTIILSLGNIDQVIQISDRRLSSNGRLIEDESNKAGILFCPNARLAFGYTGLARYGTFKTFDWLLTALHEAGPPDFIAHSILERVRLNATRTFQEHPVLRSAPRSAKKISILFSGYIYGNGAPQQGYALISNYVNIDTGYQFDVTQDEFISRYFSANDFAANPTLIQRIGNWNGITELDMYRLRQVLNERKPPQAILNIAIDFIKNLADRQKSEKYIGKQLTSICIDPNPGKPVKTNYHTSVIRRESYMPAQISLFPDNHCTISNISIKPVDDDTLPISVPKVNKNAPCPCGSKIRYKNCHGKLKIDKEQSVNLLGSS
ncbi:MAG: SEC-C domain-containing protein [Gammaproteobacteria bacterium]|nr:SEC-C domain-containing protein [Gammaproteobacteria bacterium]MBV1731784.1 SEC-C domain-containing protein [Hydrogenophaga sp.]